MSQSGFSPAERRFAMLFAPIALGFGARMAMVVFDGPLARLYTDSGYLIGVLLATGPVIAAFANPLFGRLSDQTWTRFGRRVPYAVVGVLLSSLVFFAIPSAPTYAALLSLFALRALCISVGSGPLMSLIPDLIVPERRGRAMAVFMLAGGIGAIVIQAAGKAFWERDFALVFYLTGLISMVFALPPLLFIREPSQPRSKEGSGGLQNSGALAVIAQAVVRREPIVPFLVSAALRYLRGGMVMSYVSLFAAVDLAISVGDVALMVAVTGLVRLLLALPAGRLADTYDRKLLLVLATLAGGLVYLVTGLWARNLLHLYLLVGAATLAGVMEMTAGGPLFMDLLPDDRRAQLIGINMVLTNVFNGAGALLGGALFAWTGGYRAIYPIAAVCSVLSAVILARMTVPGQAALSGSLSTAARGGGGEK